MQIIDLPYDKQTRVYDYREGAQIINEMKAKAKQNVRGRGDNRRVYKNLVCAFDIETTRVFNTNAPEHSAECYKYFSFPFCWQFMIEDIFIFGRSASDFFEMLDMIDGAEFLIVYIHNITYEYNNLADYFAGSDIFFKNMSTPLYIRRKNVEFRCSAQLTHKSLASLGEEIGYNKLKSDFDYSIDRGTKTPISKLELNYCLRDVKLLVKYIKLEASRYHKSGNPCYLPYTQTGYVRKDFKKEFSQTPLGVRILEETALTLQEYYTISRSFFGGFTHSNFRNVGREFPRILHADITSAYPWALVTQRYPYKLSKCNILFIDVYLKNLYDENVSQIAVLRFEHLKLKAGCIPYAPYSRAKTSIEGEYIDENGRIIYADVYTATLCDIDVRLILQNYTYEHITLLELYKGGKRPLPPAVVRVILKYFEAKTTLKGVEGKEYEYLLGKQKLNSSYGMCATALIHDTYTIDENLATQSLECEYTPASVMPYQWAIYCTAFVRQVIYGFVSDLTENERKSFIYSDTDSFFTEDLPSIRAKLDAYNIKIRAEIDALRTKYPNISPANPKGEIQYLGLLAEEHDDCVGFCTLGAKRYYIKHSDGTVDVTISGLRATKVFKDENGVKHNGINTQRLIDKYGDIYTAFRAIADGKRVELPYMENVDKLSSYNMRADFKGYADGEAVERPCSYLLYPVSTNLNMNETITNALIWVAKGGYMDLYAPEVFY